MKQWQHPAQLLPVRVRPVQAETLVSYMFRLAEANALHRPTMLLRALGEPIGPAPTASWVDKYEITLNPAAQHRLEIFTGIPVAQLGKALPTLARRPPRGSPATTPAFHGDRSVRLRDYCQDCRARLPGQPLIRVYDQVAPEICSRHRRWVRITATRPMQVDLAGAGSILTAQRRLNWLCSVTGDRAWTLKQVDEAEYVAREWFRSRGDRTYANLQRRWDQRIAAMSAPNPPVGLVVFPEAVTIAEVICDLDWRRHIAMAEHNVWLLQFYLLIARRLGQPSLFGSSLALSRYVDPLKSWVINIRKRWQAARHEHHRRVRNHYPFNPNYEDTIMPAIRHFK